MKHKARRTTPTRDVRHTVYAARNQTNNDLPVRRRIAARMSAGFYRTENEASQETKVHQRRDEAARFLLLAAPATRTDFSLSRELEGNEGSYGPWRSRQHRTKEATGREAPQHRSSSDDDDHNDNDDTNDTDD